MLDGEILIEVGDEQRVGDFVHDLNDVSRDAGSRPDRTARVAPAAGHGIDVAGAGLTLDGPRHACATVAMPAWSRKVRLSSRCQSSTMRLEPTCWMSEAMNSTGSVQGGCSDPPERRAADRGKYAAGSRLAVTVGLAFTQVDTVISVRAAVSWWCASGPALAVACAGRDGCGGGLIPVRAEPGGDHAVIASGASPGTAPV
jgi:hypothetical protein